MMVLQDMMRSSSTAVIHFTDLHVHCQPSWLDNVLGHMRQASSEQCIQRGDLRCIRSSACAGLAFVENSWPLSSQLKDRGMASQMSSVRQRWLGCSSSALCICCTELTPGEVSQLVRRLQHGKG